MLHKDYYRRGSIEQKYVVVYLKRTDAKTNWLAVNCHLKSKFDFNFDFDGNRWIKESLETAVEDDWEEMETS
jgi:hypothetical protein